MNGSDRRRRIANETISHNRSTSVIPDFDGTALLFVIADSSLIRSLSCPCHMFDHRVKPDRREDLVEGATHDIPTATDRRRNRWRRTNWGTNILDWTGVVEWSLRDRPEKLLSQIMHKDRRK
jgi:hypothetical protein